MAQAQRGRRARSGEVAGFLVGTAGLTALWLALPVAAPQPTGPATAVESAANAPAAAAVSAETSPAEREGAPGSPADAGTSLAHAGDEPGAVVAAEAGTPAASWGADADATADGGVASADAPGAEPPTQQPSGEPSVASQETRSGTPDDGAAATDMAGGGGTATATGHAMASDAATHIAPSATPVVPGPNAAEDATAVLAAPVPAGAAAAPDPPALPSPGRVATSLAGHDAPGMRTRGRALPTIEADAGAEPGEPGAAPAAGTAAATLGPSDLGSGLIAPGVGAEMAPATSLGSLRPTEAPADPVAVAGASATPGLWTTTAGPTNDQTTLATPDSDGPRRVVLGDGSSADGVTIRRIGAPSALADDTLGATPAPTESMPGASTSDTLVEGDVAEAAPDPATPAWVANAAFWAALDPTRPPLAVVLIDDGSAEVAGLAGALPGPVSVALDPRLPDLAVRAAAWRQSGAEVLVLAALPPDATAADAAVIYQASVAALPEAVALLDAGDGGLAGVGDVARLGLQEAEEGGLGVVLPPAGFATRPREGGAVPTVALMRDVDGQGQDARAIARFLDDAARRVAGTGGGAVLARATPESVSALADWLASSRGQAVQVAPVSALFAAP